MKGLNKAVFLDLDGTLIKTKSGELHAVNSNDWEFVDGILVSIKRYAEKGYLIIIVSNQGGIQLGKLVEEEFKNKLRSIEVELEHYIKTKVNVVYCPKMDDDYDRMPNPGMAYFMARELNLDLRRSIMIGTKATNSEFATMAAIGGYLHVSQFAESI